MKFLWKLLEKKDYPETKKEILFLWLNGLLFSVIGFCCWALVGRFALEGIDWLICFVGYAGFFGGYIGGYFFLCHK